MLYARLICNKAQTKTHCDRAHHTQTHKFTDQNASDCDYDAQYIRYYGVHMYRHTHTHECTHRKYDTVCQ